jgi:hypothetical protein
MTDLRAVVDALLERVADVQALAGDLDRLVSRPVPPPVVRVAPGDNIQGALDQLAVNQGGVLRCQPGVYKVNLRWPYPIDDPAHAVTITSDTENLPSMGTRITPEYEPGLASFYPLDPLQPTLAIKNRAALLRLDGVAFGPSSDPARTLITIGGDKRGMTSLADAPHNFVFRHVLMHGDPVIGQGRGIAANGIGIELRDSHLDHFGIDKGIKTDAQAWCAWNGAQQHRLINCYLGGSAENVLYGGADAADESLMPRDIRIEGCDLVKRLEWKDRPWNIKCLLEFKTGADIQVVDCHLENCWAGQAWDSGVAVSVKSANQENGNPWTRVENFLMARCVITHVGSYLNVTGRNDGPYLSQIARNVRIERVLGYRRDQPGKGYGVTCNDGPADLVVDHCTFVDIGSSFLDITAGDATWQPTGLRFTNSIVTQGAYGLHSQYARPDDLVVTGNAIEKNPARAVSYPPGNVQLPAGSYATMLDPILLKPIAGTPLAAVVTTDGDPVGA